MRQFLGQDLDGRNGIGAPTHHNAAQGRRALRLFVRLFRYRRFGERRSNQNGIIGRIVFANSSNGQISAKIDVGRVSWPLMRVQCDIVANVGAVMNDEAAEGSAAVFLRRRRLSNEYPGWNGAHVHRTRVARRVDRAAARGDSCALCLLRASGSRAPVAPNLCPNTHTHLGRESGTCAGGTDVHGDRPVEPLCRPPSSVEC
jgi:hypothetical protein